MDSNINYFTNVLSLDIETLSFGERLTIDEMKEHAPKNYKKDEAILKWAEENIEAEYKSRALKSLKGRLCCISVKWNDEPSHIIKYQEDEKAMLLDLLAWFKTKGKDIYTCAIIGNRIKQFDLKWIIQRAFKYDIKELLWFLPTAKFDNRVHDLSGMFNQFDHQEYTSLDDICKFLGVDSPKEKMNGSEVGDYFEAGRLEEIYTYCMFDTNAGMKCYKKMQLSE